MSARALIADIGGTHARFVLLAPGDRPGPASVAFTTAFASLEDALDDFLARAGRPALSHAAICAAGPVTDGAIAMTNCPWRVTAAGLTRVTGVQAPVLLNDFAAVAHSLPWLGAGETEAVGGGAANDSAPMLALGPGTGLGMAALVPLGHRRFKVLPGEGGHASLAPQTDREIAVLFHLLRQHGHVSVERVCSGPGLETLYTALMALDGADGPKRAAVDIAAAARSGDARCAEAVALFTSFLGTAAGNAALTLGAEGGVWLGGGILPAWGDLFDAALFRRRFDAKGRMRTWCERVPVWRVTARDLGLRGLARLVMETA